MRSELTRTQRARRDDIVHAAVALINRDGYAAASVGAIAAEADTSKGTVLYHFSSKQGIDQAVVDALFDSGATTMAERIAAAPTARAKLAAYLESNLTFIGEHAAHVRAVHEILNNASISAGPDDPTEPLRAILRDGQQTGEFTEFDPTVTALAIRAVIDIASYQLTERDDLDFQRYVRETVALFDRATRADTNPEKS